MKPEVEKCLRLLKTPLQQLPDTPYSWEQTSDVLSGLVEMGAHEIQTHADTSLETTTSDAAIEAAVVQLSVGLVERMASRSSGEDMLVYIELLLDRIAGAIQSTLPVEIHPARAEPLE